MLEERYFYNVTSLECEKFQFGGCADGSNANEFTDESDCISRCSSMPSKREFNISENCPLLHCSSVPCSYGVKKDQYGCETCDCKLDPCEDSSCPNGLVCRSMKRGHTMEAFCSGRYKKKNNFSN